MLVCGQQKKGGAAGMSVLVNLQPTVACIVWEWPKLSEGGIFWWGLMAHSSIQHPRHRNENTYAIELEEPLEPGETTSLLISMVLADALAPYPAEISQNDKQKVLYLGWSLSSAHLWWVTTVLLQMLRSRRL